MTPNTITISGGCAAIEFEGATANDYETTLAITDPTADRTVTVPDATGEVKLRATAAHDYAGGATAWTLTAAEAACSFLTPTNANGGVIAQLGSAIPGGLWVIYNATGQTLTFKVSGQTGATLANTKYGLYTCGAADIVEIWEQS